MISAGIRRYLFAFSILLLMQPFALWSEPAPVVINEVCYDPTGSDSGLEWIELYNTTDYDINLAGSLLLKGGSSFTLVYEFPSFVLRSHRFLLIGESLVSSAILVTPLGFQNGGAETDGIRLVGPGGQFTDTVLYDSPNTSGLFDDTGAVGISFAPDAAEGYSLARRMDGLDSDDCAADFLAEQNPTPGLPNHIYLDYALLHPQIWQDDGEWKLGLWVKNLSDLTPVYTAELTIRLDGVQIASDLVHSLATGDSLYFYYVIPVEDELNHALEARLDLYNDSDLSNNVLNFDLFPGVLQNPIINEVMYDPETGKQEWIELWVESVSSRADYQIRDASNNHGSFTLPMAAGFYVLCASSEQFLAQYPHCPPAALVEVSGWPSLNNTGDTIRLYDFADTLLDQMTYTGVSNQQGNSLERYLNATDQILWRYCLDSSGSTPGEENSQTIPIPDFTGSLQLTGSPCKPKSGETINLFYKLESPQSHVNCRIFDRAGHRIRILADDLLIPAEGSLTWDGKDFNGSYVPRGLYFITWESLPISGKKTLRRQFSLVIYD